MNFQTLLTTLPYLLLLITTPTPAIASPMEDIVRSPCNTTIGTFPHLTYGPTKTIYTATVTMVSTVDCNGCNGVVATPNVRVAIPVHFNTTTTAQNATTTTAYTCSVCGVGTGARKICPD